MLRAFVCTASLHAARRATLKSPGNERDLRARVLAVTKGERLPTANACPPPQPPATWTHALQFPRLGARLARRRCTRHRVFVEACTTDHEALSRATVAIETSIVRSGDLRCQAAHLPNSLVVKVLRSSIGLEIKHPPCLALVAKHNTHHLPFPPTHD